MKLIMFIIIFSLLAISVNAKTLINEIMYDPLGNDNNKEFIEIFSDEINNFENYTIEDLSGSKDTLNLVKNSSSSYSLIVEDGFNYPDINASVYTVGNTIGNGLNNEKDAIILRNPENKILDLIIYNSDLGAKNNGKSLERVNDNFIESNPEGGTPGFENSIKDISIDSVKINEFLPDPIGNDDASMPDGEFIELYSNKDFDLSDFHLEDKFGHKLNIDNTHTTTTKVKANDYLTVYTNGLSGFLNNEEDEIKLFYKNILVDKVSYSSSKEGFSWSKINGKWVLSNPTIDKNNEEGLIINKSFIKILDYDNEASFGGLVKVKLDIYKPDSNKNSIIMVIEDQNNKITDEVKFNIYGKYVNYTINVPIQIYPNCDLKYKEGEYTLKVSGLENVERKKIDIKGLNNKICNIKESKTKNDEVYFELMDFPKEITKDQEIISKVRLVNNSTESKNLELWSYVLEGKNSISGDYNDNLKKVKLNPNQEIITELRNKLDQHISPGEYKLKVKIKKEGRKTTDDFTSSINLLEIKGNFTSQDNKITNKVIYSSSDIKAKNSVYFIFIITLTLIVLFLIFRKGL